MLFVQQQYILNTNSTVSLYALAVASSFLFLEEDALRGITLNLPQKKKKNTTRCVAQLDPVEDITLMSSLRLLASVVIVLLWQLVHILLVRLFPNYNSWLHEWNQVKHCEICVISLPKCFTTPGCLFNVLWHIKPQDIKVVWVLTLWMNVWHKGVLLFKSQCSDQYVQSCVFDLHCVYFYYTVLQIKYK